MAGSQNEASLMTFNSLLQFSWLLRQFKHRNILEVFDHSGFYKLC